MKTVLAAVLLLSSMSMAQSAPSAYGQWVLPAMQSGGVTFVMHLRFQQGQVTEIADCSGFGQTTSVTVTAPGLITATQITVSSGATQSQTVGGLQCTATLSACTMNYTVSGDGKTMTVNDGTSSLAITREN